MRTDHELTDHDHLDVVCPTCLETSEVPLALIAECRLLADACAGAWRDYECPAQYYARLSAPAANDEPAEDAPLARALERWETDGGAAASLSGGGAASGAAGAG